MSALQSLEEYARKYAIKAVKADRDGDVREAISNYQKAIEVLDEILRLYPDNPSAKFYNQIISEYKKRIEALQEGVSEVSGGENGLNNIQEENIIKDKPKISFNDIIGLEEVKEALTEAIVYPSKRPDLFPLGWPRGILLYGPPGNGKTMLAAAVANEIDSNFYYIDAATIMSKWLGESERNVAKVFKLAKENTKKTSKPSIIFIDELDALLGVYTNEIGGEARVRNQFLKEMDGLSDKSENLLLYVIGATNKPWRLDEPFLRRFQKRIYVPLPDERQRSSLFKYYLSKVKANIQDLDDLVKKTEGYTASDIRDIVQEAHMKVIKEVFRGEIKEPRPIELKDLIDVLERRKPSVNKEMIRLYEEWTKRFSAN